MQQLRLIMMLMGTTPRRTNLKVEKEDNHALIKQRNLTLKMKGADSDS